MATGRRWRRTVFLFVSIPRTVLFYCYCRRLGISTDASCFAMYCHVRAAVADYVDHILSITYCSLVCVCIRVLPTYLPTYRLPRSQTRGNLYGEAMVSETEIGGVITGSDRRDTAAVAVTAPIDTNKLNFGRIRESDGRQVPRTESSKNTVLPICTIMIKQIIIGKWTEEWRTATVAQTMDRLQVAESYRDRNALRHHRNRIVIRGTRVIQQNSCIRS